jgi:hypothetical protein
LRRQPTPKVVCLVDRELGKLDDFLAVYNHGYQSHAAFVWYIQKNRKILTRELL